MSWIRFLKARRRRYFTAAGRASKSDAGHIVAILAA
jgi:hypothetical protein